MIDGAHNNESVAALVELLKEQYADKRFIFFLQPLIPNQLTAC